MPACVFAATPSFRNIDDIKPGEAMACRGLFISCLFDAAEHETETFQVGEGPGDMYNFEKTCG